MDELEKQEGKVFTVYYCPGAKESFIEAIEHLKHSKRSSIKARMSALIIRLANGEEMAGENFPKEGKLPNGRHFRAIKKIPLRAYLWLSKKHKNAYFISHFIYKSHDKLRDKDISRVCENWREIEEENGHG